MQARATLLAAGKGAAANLSQRYTHRAFPQQKVRPRASRYRMGTQIEASTSVHMADGSLPAALVFDCDGTIVDTMPLFFRENQEVCALHGLRLTKRKFYSLAGMPIRDIYLLLAKEQGVTVDIEEVLADKRRIHEKMPMPESIKAVEDVIRSYHGRLPLAVASSGVRPNVTRHLEHCGLLQFFDTVVTCEDVTHGKPAPDLFLEAARRLGVAPERCKVYEDADLGIQAAHAAGMEVVDVRHLQGYPYPTEEEMAQEEQALMGAPAPAAAARAAGESVMAA